MSLGRFQDDKHSKEYYILEQTDHPIEEGQVFISSEGAERVIDKEVTVEGCRLHQEQILLPQKE